MSIETTILLVFKREVCIITTISLYFLKGTCVSKLNFLVVHVSLAAQREQYLKDKAEQQELYKRALSAQVRKIRENKLVQRFWPRVDPSDILVCSFLILTSITEDIFFSSFNHASLTTAQFPHDFCNLCSFSMQFVILFLHFTAFSFYFCIHSYLFVLCTCSYPPRLPFLFTAVHRSMCVIASPAQSHRPISGRENASGRSPFPNPRSCSLFPKPTPWPSSKETTSRWYVT